MLFVFLYHSCGVSFVIKFTISEGTSMELIKTVFVLKLLNTKLILTIILFLHKNTMFLVYKQYFGHLKCTGLFNKLINAQSSVFNCF